MTMSEREEPDDFDHIVREISLAMGSYTGGAAGSAMHIGERLLASGWHRGPMLPEEGTPEEAAAVEKLCAHWPVYDMDPRFRDDMTAALRALRETEHE
jgi:hypothetical protein